MLLLMFISSQGYRALQGAILDAVLEGAKLDGAEVEGVKGRHGALLQRGGVLLLGGLTPQGGLLQQLYGFLRGLLQLPGRSAGGQVLGPPPAWGFPWWW